MKSLLLAPPAKEEKVVSDGAAEFRDSFTHLIHNVEAIQCFFFFLKMLTFCLSQVELGEKLCGIKEDDSFILDRFGLINTVFCKNGTYCTFTF